MDSLEPFKFAKCPCCFGGEHFSNNLQICKDEDFFVCLECEVMGSSLELLIIEAQTEIANFKINGIASKVFTSSIDQTARNYIKTRNLSPATMDRFSIGFSKNTKMLIAICERNPDLLQDFIDNKLIRVDTNGNKYETFRNRLMFPIRNHLGLIAGFGGRVIDNVTDRKYLNSEQSSTFNKSKILYGLFENKAYILKENEALIFEGYMDVTSCASKGINNTVATMGIAISKEQIFQLSRITENATFVFDGDEAGKKAMTAAFLSVLSHHPNPLATSFVYLPEGDDPDEIVKKSPGMFRHIIEKNKLSFTEFMASYITDMKEKGTSLEEVNTKLESLCKKNQYNLAKKTIIGLLCDREYKIENNMDINIENEVIHSFSG